MVKLRQWMGRNFTLSLLMALIPSFLHPLCNKLQDELNLLQVQGICSCNFSHGLMCTCGNSAKERHRPNYVVTSLTRIVTLRENGTSLPHLPRLWWTLLQEARVFRKIVNYFTTFITPFSMFKFLQALFGISSHYCRPLHKVFAGVEGLIIFVTACCPYSHLG
jgi:hypothetical protein